MKYLSKADSVEQSPSWQTLLLV